MRGIALDPSELDVKNLFFQLLNRQPIMAEYLDHREEKLAQIARVLFHKLPEARRRSVAKEMIALGFGGGFANWTSKVLQASDEGERGKVAAWLYGFETAARLYHVEKAKN